MNKTEILTLKETYRTNNVSLCDVFAIACEDAYKIRCCDVSPTVQCQTRAKQLAFPFTVMLLDLFEFAEKITQ